MINNEYPPPELSLRLEKDKKSEYLYLYLSCLFFSHAVFLLFFKPLGIAFFYATLLLSVFFYLIFQIILSLAGGPHVRQE